MRNELADCHFKDEKRGARLPFTIIVPLFVKQNMLLFNQYICQQNNNRQTDNRSFQKDNNQFF